jgi:hypothetical protein
MDFNFKKTSNFKKSLLALCCSVLLSSPLFGAVMIKNETGKSVTCIMKKGKEGTSETETISKGETWKAKCNFLKYNICPVLCFRSDKSKGNFKFLNAMDQNTKFKIVEGKNNIAVIKPMRD